MSETPKTPPEKPYRTNERGVEPRGWWIRSIIMTLMMVAFVLWRLLPVLGSSAWWWALGLGALMLAGFLVSYYYLFKKES